MSAPTNKALYRAARKLASEGQPVFPVRFRGERAKRPFTKNGVHDASTDPDQIKAWWTQHRGAAIGLPTGHLYVVLDVDMKGEVDGRQFLPYLNRIGLLDGCQRVVKTPSGGWHLYFLADPSLTNKTNPTIGIDVRAKGGYVLAPPSFLETDEYDAGYVDHGSTTGASEDPILWDEIVNAVAPSDTDTKKPITLLAMERRHSVAHLRAWLLDRKSGERNNSLHWAVWRCIDGGIDPHELVEVAHEIGLDDHEINLTINSALKRAGVKSEDLDTEADAMFNAP